MAPQTIGIRDFRAHVAKYAKAAREKGQRFIVTNNNEPLFEIVPIDREEYAIAVLEGEIADRRAGKGGITQEKLMKKHGIKKKSRKELAYEKLAAEIAEAREQVKRGEVYTQEEIMKEFGLA